MEHDGVGGSDGLSTPVLEGGLSGSDTVERDIAMASRMVKERWKVTPKKRQEIIERLMKVVGKDKCEVMTKVGPCFLDAPADKNAVAAAKVLVAMVGQNQEDEHLPMKLEAKAAAPGGVTIVVQNSSPLTCPKPIPSTTVPQLPR